MRDVIMPNAAPIPGAQNDLFRVGYARHVPGLDVACQVGWLQAYGVLSPDMYIERDPKTNSTLKRAFREFRPGDRFFVLSREVLGSADQVQTLLQMAEERHVTIQFVDEVVSYTDDR
jgi:hypothetical protein